MRLLKPDRAISLKAKKPNDSAAKHKFISVRWIVYLVSIVLVILAGLGIYRHYHPKTVAVVNAQDSIINEHKNSTDLADKRTLISAYEDKNDFSSALLIAKQVAGSTKTYQDYMAVLSICTLRNVADKKACVDEAYKNLKPLVSAMPFYSAYTVGALLEKNGYKKETITFYQRAYATYDANTGGENLMSRDQLKSHIDELSK